MLNDKIIETPFRHPHSLNEISPFPAFECPDNVGRSFLFLDAHNTNAVIGFKHVLILQTITIIPVTLTFGGLLWKCAGCGGDFIVVIFYFTIGFHFGQKGECVFDCRIWAWSVGSRNENPFCWSNAIDEMVCKFSSVVFDPRNPRT